MQGSPDAPRDGWARAAALVVVLLLTLGWAAAPDPVAAQDPAAAQDEVIEALAGRARAVIADPDTPSETLERVREELVRTRSAMRAREAELAPAVAEVRARIDALGPPPAEGETEAPEVARLRHDLGEDLSAAQAPFIVAQEAAERADALIGEIDRIERSRISAELLGHGPSPLAPRVWSAAAVELAAKAVDRVDRLRVTLATPETRAALVRRLPLDSLMLVAGIGIAFVLRRRISDWVTARLTVATDARSVAWIVALRNINRLVVPWVGAALIYAALNTGGLVGRLSLGTFLSLPAWIMVLIGAGWLSGSYFAPRLEAYRVAPLATPEALAGARMVIACGLTLAAHYGLRDLVEAWNLSPEAQASLRFPVVVAGALLIWRIARFVDLHSGALAAEPEPGPVGEAVVGPRLLRLLALGLRSVALGAPLLAAAGFSVLGSFLVVAALLTLGLLGAAAVIYDVLCKTIGSLGGPQRRAGETEAGLVPVIVGLLVIIGCAPLLALIWGARSTDIRDAWGMLAEGVSVGGMTISLDVVLKFLLVFALIAVLTRMLQSVLVGSVFPRTRLDVGAREAARAGVGYVGFAIALLAGIGAAGLNLSNLAIVAGALSVGIGFGLQAVVSNFVSGIILLVERPIKPGDWIEVGEFAGYVRGIRVRSTEIETFDRASVIIPNSQLISGTVLNRTHTGMSGRLQVMVSVTYDADPRAVERILLDVASRHPLLLEQPAPAVLLTNLGPDSMDFELRGWLRDVNYSLSVRSDLNYEILTEFAKHGIRMQFYGRDLRATAPEAGEDA